MLRFRSLHPDVDGCSSLTEFLAQLPDSALSALTIHDSNHGTHRSRLNTRGAYGAWSSRANEANNWIQVDLGSVRTVQQIATQGRDDTGQWVTSYQLAYSLEAPDDAGSNLVYVLDGSTGNRQDFVGNTDQQTIVYHDLTPFHARYVRLFTTGYHSHQSLRWGVFGCAQTQGTSMHSSSKFVS